MRFSFLPLLLSSFALSAQNPTTEVNSKIEAVTVFIRGAQVTRQAQVQLPAGQHTLVFDELTQSMDPNSIQLEGTGNLSVLSITHKRNYLTDEDKSEQMLDLEGQLQGVEKKIRRLRAEEDALQHEKKMILANQNLSSENFSLQQLQQTAEFFRKRIEAINLEVDRIQQEIQELEKQKRKIQNQLNEERKSFAQKTSQVEVKVEANAATTARFQLSYMVQNAGWHSSYDARVEDLKAPVKLTQKAVISQRTGEDWDKVNLTLNTGNPAEGQQVPYLGTWYVDFIQVHTGGGPAQYGDAVKNKMLRNADAVTSGVVEIEEEAMEDLSFQTFEVSQSLTREEYNIDRLQNIPSSGNPEVVQLRELELPAEYQYHIKPGIENSAFLVAKVYDWDQYNLMNGELSLYNGNTYVGKAVLNTLNPDDTLQLSLGRDENIVVKRQRIRTKTDKSFLGRNKVEEFTWKIEVRNTKKAPVDILLKEATPVSRNSEIEVEIEELSGGKLDEKSGIVKWQFSLPPNEQREFSVSYTVTYPRDRQVNF